jgi:hypothetical protein
VSHVRFDVVGPSGLKIAPPDASTQPPARRASKRIGSPNTLGPESLPEPLPLLSFFLDVLGVISVTSTIKGAAGK